MSEPTTGAGRRLLDDLAGDTEGTAVLAAYREGLAHDILAIEREAVAAFVRSERAGKKESRCAFPGCDWTRSAHLDGSLKPRHDFDTGKLLSEEAET